MSDACAGLLVCLQVCGKKCWLSSADQVISVHQSEHAAMQRREGRTVLLLLTTRCALTTRGSTGFIFAREGSPEDALSPASQPLLATASPPVPKAGPHGRARVVCPARTSSPISAFDHLFIIAPCGTSLPS